MNPKRRIGASNGLHKDAAKRVRRDRPPQPNSEQQQIEAMPVSGERMENEMENIVQRTDAAKWFWPFMLVAAIAAATIIAFPPFPAKATAEEPQFHMSITVSARDPHVADRTPVTIEPLHITVLGKRSPSFIDRLAGFLPQRRQPS
jgi:hypothetical protein